MSEEKKTSESETPQSTTMDQLDNLEVANDFDDLNLEIVSEKPTANSIPESPDATGVDSGPSIDEFIIAKEELPVAQHHPSDQWFAEVLGQEIGPFPFEELVHLVANEEVGPEDKIRHTILGEWMVAGDIAGLFPEIETDFELGGGAEFLGTELVDGDTSEAADNSDFRVVGGELNHILSDTRPKGSAPENIQEQEAPQNADAEQSDTAQNDTASQDSSTEEETEEDAEAKRKREIAERLNAWLGDHVEEPVVEITQEKKQSEQPVTTPTASAHAPISPSSSDATTTYKPPVKPGPPPKAKKFKKAKQSGEKIDFSGLAKLIDAKVLGAVGVVVLFALVYFFMPNILSGTNDKKIYDRYQEIYAQIQRARKSNPGQLATIAKEVVPELKDTVTALENAGAGAKKPAKQKLFFGGKYCLIPILEKKIVEPGKLDEKFEKYMEEVDGLLKK